MPSLISRGMKTARRAVIDVGTNSVKLLVADVSGREVQPVWEESKQTRLGRGFYETHRLQSEAIDATGKAVAQFSETARKYTASAIRVIATSAARDAVNSGELSVAIEKASGLKMEIISGEQEAEWVFQGVTTDPTLAASAGQMLFLLDVGGGSTEFILGLGEHKCFQQSYPIGTVRLLEKYPPSDPPTAGELANCRAWLRNFLEKEVLPQIDVEKLLSDYEKGWDGSMRLVGTGGTTSILARMEAKLETYDRAKIEATRLNSERMHWHVEHLWSLPLEERKHIVGLPANRADVILMGVAIYEAVMETFGFKELRISTRGLRFAAVMG
jgi:exopolyphosphatase / guanosine-5'-triphosphate,3'-diphosphate pyrophosphatase